MHKIGLVIVPFLELPHELQFYCKRSIIINNKAKNVNEINTNFPVRLSSKYQIVNVTKRIKILLDDSHVKFDYLTI